MTFLELVQALAQEAAVNGEGPSTTVALVDEPKRVRDWIVQAWIEIQGTKLWNFLWEQVDIVMLDTTNVLATTVPETRWLKDDTWLPQPVTSDNTDRQLDYIRYSDFNAIYRRLGDPGSINTWSIRPDNAFVVNAKAVGDTTINVQRYRAPQILVADGDVPLLPEDLHMLIVWTALKKYAGYDEAGNQRAIALDEMKIMKEALYTRCLPSFSMGGSLLDLY